MGVVKRILVSEADRAELERIVRASSSEVRMAERARIVLCAGAGLKGEEITGLSPEFRTVVFRRLVPAGR